MHRYVRMYVMHCAHFYNAIDLHRGTITLTNSAPLRKHANFSKAGRTRPMQSVSCRSCALRMTPTFRIWRLFEEGGSGMAAVVVSQFLCCLVSEMLDACGERNVM